MSPYQRIIRAARLGRGVRLSADEVAAMIMDDAIETVARNDDEADKRRKGKTDDRR